MNIKKKSFSPSINVYHSTGPNIQLHYYFPRK